jgi:hypothetical protein
LTAVVNTPAAWAGAGLWLVAAAAGAVGFVLQGEGALAAADLLTSEGRIPDGFWPLHRVQEALLRFYGATGLLASALIGVGVLRTTWLPGSIGWAALIAGSLGAAAIAVGLELIPAVTQLVAAVFGVAIVVPPRGAAVSVAGEAS